MSRKCRSKKVDPICSALAGQNIILNEILEVLNSINTEPTIDYEYKEVSRTKYCLDGITYELIICHKMEDGTLVEEVTIIVGPTGVIESLPLGAEICQESLVDFEVINTPICFEDGTKGFKLIKINTLTDEVTFLGNYDDNGVTTKVTVECGEYKIVESTVCINNKLKN